jgi:putative selenate reductase
MAELCPVPLPQLVSRMLRELEEDQAIFDLPREKFFLGSPGLDLTARFQDHTAWTPLGPAAGPHTQLAQNVLLGFLGGGRIFELKTVQILDELKIPRPCIDLTSVGYNVEWSQELKLEQSLEEYVKASMLIEILAASGRIALPAGAADCIFDMSVGYDLAGIRTDRVRAFLAGMKDCTAVVDRLRPALPAAWRDLPFRTRLSDTLTLSTFHGCPPEEIERIADHLLRVEGLHTIVKLNPTLLGPAEARRILHGVLGYREQIPDVAFEKDAQWQQAVDFTGRLAETARSLGRGFGVKLTNTLIVENHRDFFPPSEKVMYLSGAPLHVLAIQLVAKLREVFGGALPLSFSAGVDKQNFADTVSLGLLPVTVCTDLLREGGYGRMKAYFGALASRMAAAGARTLDEWVVRARGGAASPVTPATLEAARVANARAYAAEVLQDKRYGAAAHAKAPRKVGSKLWLFDCLTCDKCVPVCPNDANFTYVLPKLEIPVLRLRPRAGGGFDREELPPLVLEKKHQLATYADLCNECGNCDIFCPEDGGPYAVKPRFFGSEESFRRFATHDGVYVARRPEGDLVLGRFGGRALRLEKTGAEALYAGEGFELRCTLDRPEETLQGRADPGAVIDLTWLRVMEHLRGAVLDGPGVSWVNTGSASGSPADVRASPSAG